MPYTCSGHDISFLFWAPTHYSVRPLTGFNSCANIRQHSNGELPSAGHIQQTTESLIDLNLFLGTSNKLLNDLNLLGTSNKLLNDLNLLLVTSNKLLNNSSGHIKQILLWYELQEFAGWKQWGMGKEGTSCCFLHPAIQGEGEGEIGTISWNIKPGSPRGNKGPDCANPNMVTGGTWSSLRSASCVAVLA